MLKVKSKSIQKAKEGKETKGGLMLNPAQSPLTAKQLLHILQKTPKNHIYTREGKGGKKWDYVTGVYVKKVLNYVFGWIWSFKAIERPTVKEVLELISGKIDQIWVYGELTIEFKNGMTITKGQEGRADIKFYKNTRKPLDIGNDIKSAITDSLKKCASELGIASDIYGREEFKEIQTEDKSYIPPKNNNGEKDQGPLPAKPKLIELKAMLKGKTDAQKLADIARRSGLKLDSFEISEKHAGIVIASLLNSEVK